MMNYSGKISAYPSDADVDTRITQQAWLGIYQLIADSSHKATNPEEMIKAAKKRFSFKAEEFKSWFDLKRLLIGEKSTATQRAKYNLDTDNELVISKLPIEIAPFLKELIFLAREEKLHVKILDRVYESDERLDLNYFGLSFDIAVFRKSTDGALIYDGDILLYGVVARLAESIGLTWAANQKLMTNMSRFELRPSWSLRMKENDMLEELKRRKGLNINLLSILT